MVYRWLRSPLSVALGGALLFGGLSAGYRSMGPSETIAHAEPDPRPIVPSEEGRLVGVDEPEAIVRVGPRLLEPADPEQPGLSISIEDADGHSMDRLHAALRRAEADEGQARLLFYGASHVASDLFTGIVRRRLQGRFGDAGHGIIVPGKPWRSYRHRDIRVEANGRWDSARVRGNTREIGHYGVAGTYVETDREGAYSRVRTARSGVGTEASLFDLYYLRQPGGGSFDVLIDGQRRERVSTDGLLGGGYATFEVPMGPHSFEVRTRGGAVRLFGLAVERQEPGVIVDTLGINGARARYHLLWEDQLYREHLARRQADLVVLAYGTNESGDDLPIEIYEEQLNTVVSRVREVAPQAACLLIGPSDRPIRREDGTFENRPRTAALVATQHKVAVEQGCGFFDLVSFSGGALSMVEWAASDPPYAAPDHIHYTRRGYERLGEVMVRALLEGMDNNEDDAHGEPEAGAELPPASEDSE